MLSHPAVAELVGATSSYSYRALTQDGRVEKGSINAQDRPDAFSMLAARGLTAFDVRKASERGGRLAHIPAEDLAVGLRILSTLLDSGLPHRRIAGTFATLAPKSWTCVVDTLQTTLREGRSLSAALGESHAGIPPVVIGIIRAGEAGATVPGALRDAADLAESSAATRAAIRGALAYPAVLVFAGGVSVALLVAVVLPRFATILADIGQTLPTSTRLVLTGANWIRRAAIPATLVTAGGWLTHRLWVRSGDGLQLWHHVLLQVPILGRIRHALATARGSAALSALLGNGLAMPAALAHAENAVGDAAVAHRLRNARNLVITGRSLGSALNETSAFTPSTVRLIRAGEEAGQLTTMLAHARHLEEDQAAEQLRRLIKLIEPMFILIFAGIIGLIAASLLQAVYAVRPT